MPKAITINPSEVRKEGILHIKDIYLNSYKSDIEKEKERFGEKRLITVLYDMLIIREFETMLNTIKTQGVWEGIEYNHLGPAHLSIGQEASAAGEALALSVEDMIFGSHRSHGEVIAKCMACVHTLDDKILLDIMKDYLNSKTLSVVEKGHKGDVKDLAEDFVLYGTLAEIFGRDTGFNRGLGGSMHVFFPPFGSMPNNAIVGGSADIACGAALFKKINDKPGIVVANIGDGSTGCGPVWESMMLSSMDQYKTLWDKEPKGSPPILFAFFNNFYGMGGQTFGETMGFGILARIGAGVNPDNMHAERIDGYNPLAVADAVLRKKKILLEGKGPCLLDIVTYRISGHSPSDASSYRTKEEISLWEQNDCIKEYSSYLIKNNLLTESDYNSMKEKIKTKLIRIVKLAVSLEDSPRPEPELIAKVMFSNKKVEKFDKKPPEVLLPFEENPRVKSLKTKSRFGIDPETGNKLPRHKVFTLRDALFESLIYKFYQEPTMIAFGEENRDWGGAFGVYRGLTESLPYHRLFNTPISEGAIIGAGTGYALCGGRAVVELMYCDFMGRAGDELFNQTAKWQAMSAGILSMPLVIRISIGAKYGAQHSQDWTSIVSHIPGLKSFYPATPYDAKGMLNLALSITDPVVFFESQKLYDIGEYFVPTGVPEGYYEIPEGEPVIRRKGNDITIITLGPALYKAIEAAEILESKYGISTEVIDLRFIVPLNYDIIFESVRKTKRVVLVTEACERSSFMSEVATNISSGCFDRLDAPPSIVGSRNWITPQAEMENYFFPQKEWILDTIHERILPLPGHKVTTNRTKGELFYRHRRGV